MVEAEPVAQDIHGRKPQRGDDPIVRRDDHLYPGEALPRIDTGQPRQAPQRHAHGRPGQPLRQT